MWKSGVVAILALLLSLSSESLIVHEKRNLPFHPEHALERRRAESDALLPMRIGLKQNRYAMKNAEAWLMSVSQPDSPQYGQHWSQEEVIDAFKPSEDTLQNVTEWLHSYGITDFTHTDNKLWFAFDASVAKMESMLQTEYQEHMRRDGGFEVSCDHYSYVLCQFELTFLSVPSISNWHLTKPTTALNGHTRSGEKTMPDACC